MKLKVAFIATCAACAALVACSSSNDSGNDVAEPTLSIAATNASLMEGNSGATNFTFTVSRAGATSGASSANWAVSSAAAAGADFVGGVFPSGTVSFAAGDTSKLITVAVAGDTAVEADEPFTVTLSGPIGATLGTATASGTIVNDDQNVGPVPLSEANYLVAAREGIAPASYLLTASSIIVGAQVNNPNLIFSFSRAQLAKIGERFSAASAQFTGVEQTYVEPCYPSGSLTITVNDVNGNELADPGDSIAITASNCEYDGAVINGDLNLVVVSASGLIGYPPYTLTANFTLDNLTVQSGDISEAATGQFALSANVISETSGTVSTSVTTLSMSSNIGTQSASRTLTAYTLVQTISGASATISANGTVSTSLIQSNALTVETVSPFVAVGDEPGPSLGQMLISAAQGGKVRITAISGANAMIELDADGNGTYETSTTLSWDELI